MGDRSDVRRMVADERRDLAAFLRTLGPEDWERPSLCERWRVRDVVAHLLYDDLSPAACVVAGFHSRSADDFNAYFVDACRDLPTSALVDRLESSLDGGWMRRLVPRICLADAVVHHQDIRRPLGRPRDIPAERLLSALRHPDPLARPTRYTRGLRFAATDLDWTQGDGPEVRGPAEALALAVVGRPAALEELTGDGVPTLRERLSPPAS